MARLKRAGVSRALEAIGWAAGSGQVAALSLALSWLPANASLTPVRAALMHAATSGQLATMKLAHERGATNITVALYAAAMHGRLAAMELTRSWGACDYNGALLRAASGGELAAVERLRDWGASDLDGALVCAAKCSYADRSEMIKYLVSAGALATSEAIRAAKQVGNWQNANAVTAAQIAVIELAAANDHVASR